MSRAPNSVFLEVDPKIVENNLLIEGKLGGSDFEEIFHLNKNSAKEEPWKLITPTPGFVIKLFDLNGSKVFINLCQADEIPEPDNISETELLRLWESDEITDYRIPLSILDPHDELDKSGKKALVYDVAINTRFFSRVKENIIFRSFVIQVVQEGLENKFNIQLNKEGTVILKNRNCIGVLKPHRIRSREGPYKSPPHLIEEIDHFRTGENTVKEGCKSETADPLSNKSNYRLLHGNNVLIGQFHLPGAISGRDVNLEVGRNRIRLDSKASGTYLDVFLPCSVNEQKISAHFNHASKLLTILASCCTGVSTV